MMWDTRRVKVTENLIGDFSISICIKLDNSEDWWFLGIYGPPSVSSRGLFWDEVVGLSEICGSNWCLGGDFNVVRNIGEKRNSLRITRSMRTFDELIREVELQDPPLINAQFTWSNFREHPICCRLDRFLFSKGFSEMFSYFRQEAVVRCISDHSPIILSTNPPTWGPTPFRFENMWLEHRLFKANVSDWLQQDVSFGRPGYKFMRKLKTLKQKITRWNKEVFGDLRIEKKKLEKRIKELDVLEGSTDWNVNLEEERFKAKSDWYELIMKEERATMMKSKFTWAKEGDANSKLFHNLMNGRRARNAITKLERANGELLTENEEIAQEIISFFSRLYSSSHPQFRGIDGIDWSPITNEDAVDLVRPFEEEEVKKAVFDCDGNKSPGPDGFTLAFFQRCWEEVKAEVMSVLNDFHSSGVVNRGVNETYIALIPKKYGSCRISDFRPISLVTSLYKIISKVLVSRLKEVLDSTISKNQGAFVANRQILDVALVANEVVEDVRATRRKGVVFKIDFEKAYDHVEWEFLDFVLERKGFGLTWRKWIWGCLSSMEYFVILNGRPRGKFKGTRGLRQGDPLSPFLFTLVADVLGRMTDKLVIQDRIQCLEVGRENTKVSHLQYADDTLFFLKEEENNIRTLYSSLKIFSAISGLRINFGKSTLLGINLEEEEVAYLAELVECSVGVWPVKYLGLPLGGNPKSKIFWEPVVIKVARRLDGWKRAFLSRGGRLTLIRSVLSSLPIYYMSLFKMPQGITDNIEKLMRDFLWGSDTDPSSHLVRWEEVIKPKQKGGLEIGNMILRNKSLLVKWLWRFTREGEMLWHKVIGSKFGMEEGGWLPCELRNTTY